MNPKILFQTPHMQLSGSDVEYCVDYALTEEVEGILTGEVGYVAAYNELMPDAVEVLKQMAVDQLNGLQSTYTFDVGDVLTFGVA